MSNEERDQVILKKIKSYCAEIKKTQLFFGESYLDFKDNSIYKNAVALCILQIGELTGSLSVETKEQFSEVPWRNIKGMRNIVAHKYGDISAITVWEAIMEDIPRLNVYCEYILSQMSQKTET